MTRRHERKRVRQCALHAGQINLIASAAISQGCI